MDHKLLHKCDVDCSAYTINAGADITVGTETVTGKGSADINLSLGGYTASDITTNSSSCTFKAGTTWTCSNLVPGVHIVAFAANKDGESKMSMFYAWDWEHLEQGKQALSILVKPHASRLRQGPLQSSMPARLRRPYLPFAVRPAIAAGCQTIDVVKISVTSARAVQHVEAAAGSLP
jgi:hypothetical protein